MHHHIEPRIIADRGGRRARPAVLLLAAALAAAALAGCTPAWARQTPTPTPTPTPSPTAGTERSRPARHQVRLDERPMPTAGSNAFSDDGDSDSDVTEQFVHDYLDQVVHSVDRFWTRYFTRRAPTLHDPSVRYVIVAPGRPFTSRCLRQPVTTDYNNAFFCPADADAVNDGAIVLPLRTFHRIWNGQLFGRATQKSDFVAAAIVAHEFGHHIQYALASQLGLPDIVDNSGPRPKRSRNKELIADCFAGLWSRSVYRQGYLDDGDLYEAIHGSRPSATARAAPAPTRTVRPESAARRSCSA